MNDYWEEMEKMEEERDAQEYAEAMAYSQGYEQGRADAIDEYSNQLWQVIEKCTVNCKLDFNIDDLHNLEVIIKGLAEELKELKDE